MNPPPAPAVFDTNTLINFAVVDRLDLLRDHYGYGAMWTETVHLEIRKGLKAEPRQQRVLDSGWLGNPVEIDGSVSTLLAVDQIRRALGGRSAKPTQHLGEAEIIYYIEHESPGAIFITDDRAALDFARRRGIFAIDSPTVLGECYSYSRIGCPHAYDLLVEMRRQGRGVLVPDDHTAVC